MIRVPEMKNTVLSVTSWVCDSIGGGAAYISWANRHPFMVHVHSRNDYAHFTRSFESQNIGFLYEREEKTAVATINP